MKTPPLNKQSIGIMKRNWAVFHFLFAAFAADLLAGCGPRADIATHDAQNSVDKAGTVMVSTFAGGEHGYADGMAGDAKFRSPQGIAIDAAGSLYVGGTEMIYKVVFATEPSD